MEVKQDNIPQVIIDNPGVLGDTYEEVIESLSRLTDAGLSLYIASQLLITPFFPKPYYRITLPY